jgi:hypothetical protein
MHIAGFLAWHWTLTDGASSQELVHPINRIATCFMKKSSSQN